MRASEQRYRITIRNWETYQRDLKGTGARRRRRHWIAITVHLGRDPDFLRLTESMRLCWIMMLCHAGAVGPIFKMSPADARLLFKLRRNPDFDALKTSGFIDLEKLSEEEAMLGPAKTQTPPDPNSHDARLEQLKSLYPKRVGSQPWRRAMTAANARMKEGATWEELMDGVRRYAAFCDGMNKTGTQFVMMAATFLGPERHFDPEINPWQLPPSAAESRTERNVAAAQEALAEGD